MQGKTNKTLNYCEELTIQSGEWEFVTLWFFSNLAEVVHTDNKNDSDQEEVKKPSGTAVKEQDSSAVDQLPAIKLDE